MRSFLLGVACTVLIALAAALLFLYFPISGNARRPDSLAAMKKVSEVERLIRAKALDEVDGGAQVDAMIEGMVAGLDDLYADYYTKEEYAEVRRSHAGRMQGIGVVIAQDLETGYLRIISVQDDSPAQKAGIQEDDILLSVGGEDMAGKTSTDAAAAIQATEGPVTLTVRRGATETLEFTMEKADIKTSSVSFDMLEDGIGYIHISTFNDLTPEQFGEGLATLREEGMHALIIDLRNNLGGLVNACCDTVSQILPKGVILYEQDRVGGERHLDSAGKTPIDIPLVLLVNGYTASASEIFTGAVRDYGIATIVGEQTYGKGVEQNTYILADGSALKLTTTVYYTPSRENINDIGITPDVVVELTEEDEEDMQLAKALEILSEKKG